MLFCDWSGWKSHQLEVRKRDVGVLLDYQYSVGFISSEYFDYEQNLLFQTMIILIKKIVNLHPKIVFLWAVESVSFLLRYLSKYYFKKTSVLFDVNLDLCIHGLNYRKLAQNWKEQKCSFIIKKNLVSCKISSWCTSSGCEKTFRITLISSELPLSRNVK